MHMLQAGVDVTSLALLLGHASPTTTHGYLEADLSVKEKALRKLDAPSAAPDTLSTGRPVARLPRRGSALSLVPGRRPQLEAPGHPTARGRAGIRW
jgi:hypothetical protein